MTNNPRPYNEMAFDLDEIFTIVQSAFNPENFRNRRYSDNQNSAYTVCKYLSGLTYWYRAGDPEFSGHTERFYKSSPEQVTRSWPPFLLHEDGAIMEGVDDILLGNGNEAYWRNVLIQHAYLDAINHVPRMNDNNISNLLEIIAFLKSVVIDKRIEIPKSLASGWLAYRYQYSTGKADLEEAVSYVTRRRSLKGVSKIKCYGTHSIEYKGVMITCRCEFEVENKLLSTVRKVWRALSEYGLSPSFYVIWDMIPYSFIVDWFLPIGDVMAAWDASGRVEQYYDIKNVNFSLSYTQKNGCTYSYYTRWFSGTPIPLQGYYFLEDSSPSDKTVKYRVLDALSLILG